ncbi:MAG TPA: Gldg family protein, partial [Thermoanaerobaculia bacterium]
ASLGAAAVPEGADLVIVAGPRTPFTEPERDVLKKYLDAGGRVLFFLDVEFSPGASRTLSDFGLAPLLSSMGLTLDSDVVVDPKNALPGMAETVFAKSYRSHPVTRLLTGIPVVFPLARSVSVAKAPVPGWKTTPLVETSADGWGETNLKDLERSGHPKKDDKDVAGPVSLAVAVEQDEPAGAAAGGVAKPAEASKKKGRIVVFGDADWASNAGIANAANLLLLSSAANWALERESLVAIPPKSADQVAVTLTRRDIGQVAFVVMLLLPLAAIAMGVAIWARRRK